MRKSGLQKQIAFIFDDVSMPQTDSASMKLPAQQPQKKDNSNPAAQDAPLPQQGAAAQPLPAAKTHAVHTPAVPTMRPRPLPKSTAVQSKQKTGSTLGQQVRKALFGSAKGTMDPRQKKMTIMVAVLAVVFAGVLTVSLGGLGQKSQEAAPAAADEPTAVKPAVKSLQEWQMPEPLPAELRNPMAPQAAQRNAGTDDAQPGQMIVKGIVFSKTNPTAIIGEKIVSQGETVNGATVVTITRDSVEFEKDGRRWVQPVQR